MVMGFGDNGGKVVFFYHNKEMPILAPLDMPTGKPTDSPSKCLPP